MAEGFYEGRKVGRNKKGYPVICYRNKIIPVHIYVWERANLVRPPGLHIHHKDHNKENYSLENLELLDPKDHNRLHAGWFKNQEGDWESKPCLSCKTNLSLDKFYTVKTRNTVSAWCRECTKAKSREARKKPDYQDKHNAYVTAWRKARRSMRVLPK